MAQAQNERFRFHFMHIEAPQGGVKVPLEGRITHEIIVDLKVRHKNSRILNIP